LNTIMYLHRTASNHQKAVDEASATHRMVIDKLQEGRAMMEVRDNHDWMRLFAIAGNRYNMSGRTVVFTMVSRRLSSDANIGRGNAS